MAAGMEHTFSLNPGVIDLRRRSKHGCIDCKAAKVRCDEARPSCATCTRRKRVCRGYAHHANAKSLPRQEQHKSPSMSPAKVRIKTSSDPLTPTSPISEFATEEDDTRQSPCSNISDKTNTSLRQIQEQLFDSSTSTDLTVRSSSRALDASLRAIPKSIPSIPAGTIPEADCSTINVYFKRHPVELVISSEFVDEMNAVVLMVLQDSPSAIGDALYGIGRVYLDQDSQSTKLPLALNRRARTLARLRVKDPNCELEQMLVMMLALSGMEVL